LDDSEKFIDEVSFDAKVTQAQLSVDNLKTEITAYLTKNKADVEDILSNEIFSSAIPLNYGNVNTIIHVQNYEDRYDINVLNGSKNDDNTTAQIAEIEELFSNNEVDGFFEFEELIQTIYKNNSKKRITNSKQFNSTITAFIRKIRSDKILGIKDKLYFIPPSTDADKLVFCSVDVNLSNTIVKSNFIYEVNTGRIEDFEFVLK